ncbi:MAG TPA: glycine-rich domain-containing protein-like, partial [Terriglobales bacterium]|nr:glycine-rich domain-containing protein-like [Terriglobales bacterium]
MVLPNLSFDVLHDAKFSEGYFANCNEELVRESERRYKQFLNLARKYPEAALTPAIDIDEVWHMHMLRPVAYQKDCYSLFGEILDHDGGFGK